MKQHSTPLPHWVAWATALAASCASIYFIEILGNPAAALCWVDRMLIFGLFLILSVMILAKDSRGWVYTVPFLAIGLPVSFFQQLIHWDVIQFAGGTCSTSVVCTTKYFNLLGFISQATLCLAAFVVVAICIWRMAIKQRKA